MSWEVTLDQYGRFIEDKIKEYLSEILDKAHTYHSFIATINEALKEFVLRKGKRLASFSTFLTYSSYAGKVDERILKVCVGIELYRHSILFHDDFVDKDDFRRGEKTVHRIFSELRDERFGEGIEVFLGDIAFALAVSAVMSSGFEEEKLIDVFRVISEGYHEVNESQILDLLFEGTDVSVEEWYVMASRRASSLFKVAMLVGAILGGASQKDSAALEEAAMNIGYSFDIQDDIIDTYATADQYGRSPGRDLTLGKKPLHVICTLTSSNQEKSEALRKLLCKRLTTEEVELAKLIIKDSGGLEESKKISRTHAEKAKMIIARTGLNEYSKNFFSSFINYIEESLEWYK